MRRSRKELETQVADQGARVEGLVRDREGYKQQAIDAIRALRKVSRELSDLKDEVALHIVAAQHPSSALSDAHSMAISLQEAMDARGIDLRIELGRLEGTAP
jgi:hypothetical protein